MMTMRKLYLGVFITTLLLVAGLIFLISSPEKKNTMIFYPPESCWPIMMIGDGGKRIYLKYDTIYAFKNDPSVGYNIVNSTLDVPEKIYRTMIFFHSPEEAEKAGYKPALYFGKKLSFPKTK